jgi:L-ribulose-5-phosphate 3-epimerase
MSDRITRRNLLKRGVAVGGGAALLSSGAFAAGSAGPFTTQLRKAVIVGAISDEAALMEIRQAGFGGVECKAWDVAFEDAEKAGRLARNAGLEIHAVMRGSAGFNEPGKMDAAVESVETALRAAGGYGADAILLVPGRVRRVAMPKPLEFDVAFDTKTGRLERVVAGDNSPYQDYMAAHNQALDSAREGIERLIPVAKESGVVIAVENVWNNLWPTPELLENLVGSFESPWVRAYFDIGNHVKYGRRSEEWIRVLGSLTAKCHVKDFLLGADGSGGKFVNIREGSVDWPAVRQALDDVDYNGWMTIEGSGGLSLAERNERLDLIVAAK